MEKGPRWRSDTARCRGQSPQSPDNAACAPAPDVQSVPQHSAPPRKDWLHAPAAPAATPFPKGRLGRAADSAAGPATASSVRQSAAARFESGGSPPAKWACGPLPASALHRGKAPAECRGRCRRCRPPPAARRPMATAAVPLPDGRSGR